MISGALQIIAAPNQALSKLYNSKHIIFEWLGKWCSERDDNFVLENICVLRPDNVEFWRPTVLIKFPTQFSFDKLVVNSR